jgi:hypothetical protein
MTERRRWFSRHPWLRALVRDLSAGLACTIVLLSQTVFRVPSGFLFVLIPLVTVALSGLCVAVFVNHVLRGVREDDPLRKPVRWAEFASGVCVRVFVVYGLFLFANAALDRTETNAREADVVEIVGADLNFSFIPHAWVSLRRLDDPNRVERILLSPADPPLWPGQPVILHMRAGFFRLPWVAQVAVDDVRQSLATLKQSPGAAEPMKSLIRGYAMRDNIRDGVATTLEYERLHPTDHDYPERIALGLGMAGDCASMYRLLEPFIGRRTDYEFFTYVGWALACLKRRDEAMTYLEKAIALEPENWWAYYHIGYMYFDAQKFEQAEPFLQNVLTKRHIPDVARDIGTIQKIVALKRAREAAQPIRPARR